MGRGNSNVSPVSLSLDTSPEIERRQIECWRQMSPAQKAAMVSGLTLAVYDLALAGISIRHPDSSARAVPANGSNRPRLRSGSQSLP
jgi:hypothetical protein